MNARLAEQLAALRLAAHQAVEDAVEADLGCTMLCDADDAAAMKAWVTVDVELEALIHARAEVLRAVGRWSSSTTTYSLQSSPGALRRYERALGELRAERKLAAAQVARATAKRKAKPAYITSPHEPKEFTGG